jgi:aminopeptidase N
MGRGLVWPQQLTITVGYGGDVKTVPVDMRAATATLPGVEGRERPRFVLPNGGGLGYGLFVLDDVSRAYLVDHIEQLPDPLTRGSAWVTLWDNLLEGAVAAPALFDTALRALPSETDEQNVQRILGYARGCTGGSCRRRSGRPAPHGSRPCFATGWRVPRRRARSPRGSTPVATP